MAILRLAALVSAAWPLTRLATGQEVAAETPCHRVDSDGLTCTQSTSKDSCDSDYVHDGACFVESFKYCFKGAFGMELWVKGDGASCAEGMKVLAKTGYKNDGCGGKSAPLPCGSHGLAAAPPCHRVESDGLTCTQSESKDSCSADYAQFKDGACGSEGFQYCFKGAFGTELWARGDGASCAEGMKVLANTGYKNDGCGGKSSPLPCGAKASLAVAAEPPCHRVDTDGLTCTQSESKDSCAADYAQYKDGACGSEGFQYCFKGAFGTEMWASGDGGSCAEGLKVLAKTGYKNDGCGGKSSPLPCGAKAPLAVAAEPPCHRVDSDGLTCTQSESKDSCAADYAQYKDGACGSEGFQYCLKGAFGTEMWARGDGASCAEGLKVLAKTGYKNDGCGGKSSPLPCGAATVLFTV